MLRLNRNFICPILHVPGSRGLYVSWEDVEVGIHLFPLSVNTGRWRWASLHGLARLKAGHMAW